MNPPSLDLPEPDDTPPEIVWAIRRADGFMDLEMWTCAARELDTVPVPHREATPYLQLALRAAMAAENWESARESALVLAKRTPDEPGYWIQLAYATRRAVNLEAAHAILTEAIRRFPGEAIFSYNLGCYECCRGNEEASLAHLRVAFQLDPVYIHLAGNDPDLAGLKHQLDGLVAAEFGEAE